MGNTSSVRPVAQGPQAEGASSSTSSANSSSGSAEFSVAELKSNKQEDESLLALQKLVLDQENFWQCDKYVCERDNHFHGAENGRLASKKKHLIKGHNLHTANILSLATRQTVSLKDKSLSSKSEGKNDASGTSATTGAAAAAASDDGEPRVLLSDYYASKQVQWIQKEVQRLSDSLPCAFAAQLDTQVDFVHKFFVALKRHQVRLNAYRATAPRDVLPPATPANHLVDAIGYLDSLFGDEFERQQSSLASASSSSPSAVTAAKGKSKGNDALSKARERGEFERALERRLAEVPDIGMLNIGALPAYWDDYSAHADERLKRQAGLEKQITESRDGLATSEKAHVEASERIDQLRRSLGMVEGVEERADEAAQLQQQLAEAEQALNDATQRIADLSSREESAVRSLEAVRERAKQEHEERKLREAERQRHADRVPSLVAEQRSHSADDVRADDSLLIFVLRHLHTTALRALDDAANADALPAAVGVIDIDDFSDGDGTDDGNNDEEEEEGEASAESSSLSSPLQRRRRNVASELDDNPYAPQVSSRAERSAELEALEARLARFRNAAATTQAATPIGESEQPTRRRRVHRRRSSREHIVPPPSSSSSSSAAAAASWADTSGTADAPSEATNPDFWSDMMRVRQQGGNDGQDSSTPAAGWFSTMMAERAAAASSGGAASTGDAAANRHRVRQRQRRKTRLPHTESGATPPPYESAATELLGALQRELARAVACSASKSSAGGDFERLVAYVLEASRLASTFLDAAKKRSDALGSAADALDARVRGIAARSYLYHAVRPLFVLLVALLRHGAAPLVVALSSSIAQPVFGLLRVVDQFNECDEAARSVDAELRALESIAVLDSVDVETPHNYSKSTEKESIVTVPGATHLYVSFDPRCATSNNDRLELYCIETSADGTGETARALVDVFGGPSTHWPTTPLVLRGNTIALRFCSDAFDTDWGFRTIVRGVIVQRRCVAVYEFERAAAALAAQCALRLASGKPPSHAERLFERYLDSGLFSRPQSSDAGAGNDDYVRALVANTAESKAAADVAKLLSFRNMRVRRANWRNSLARLKGPLRDTVQRFVAVLLVHERLLDAAKADEPSDEQVAALNERVYTSAARLSMNLQQKLAELLKSNANQDEAAAAAAAQSDGAAASSSSPPPPSTDAAAAITPEQFVEQINGRLDALLSEFAAGPVEHPAELIVDLLTVPPHDAALATVIGRRTKRAEQRTLGLRLLAESLRSVRNASVRQQLLQATGKALIDGAGRDALGRCGHPTVAVDGVAQPTLAALTSAFYALFGSVSSLLVDDMSANAAAAASSSSLSNSIAACQLAVVNYRRRDFDVLLDADLLKRLHAIATNEQYALSVDERRVRLQTVAWHAFRFLALRCVAGVTEHDLMSAASWRGDGKPLHALAEQGVELILSTLERALPVLKERRALMNHEIESAADDESEAREAYYREEDYIYRFLSTLLLVTQPADSDALLRSTRVGSMLFAVHTVGTLRLKRVALRLLRRVLPLHTPESAAALLGADAPSSSIIDHLFGEIGRTLVVGDPDERTEPQPPETLYFDGEVEFSHNCELVMLCRVLFESALWRDTMRATVTESLGRVPSLVDVGAETLAAGAELGNVYASLAALAVIGGHTDKIRVGGRVEIKDSKETATVVEYDRYASSTRLLVDSMPTKISRPFDANRVLPLAEIEHRPSSFPLSAALLPTFFVFSDTIRRRAAQVEDEANQRAIQALLAQDGASSSSSPKKGGGGGNADDDERCVADLAFHQLRSRTLQALAKLVRHSESAECIARENALPELLRLAVLPSELSAFKTLEQLEQQEERLWELLFQRRHAITEPQAVQRLTQTEVLPFSIFARAGPRLPTGFDRATARQVRFPAGHSDMRVVVGHIAESRSLFATGQVRANFPVPHQLKAFYFEVTLLPALSVRAAKDATASTLLASSETLETHTVAVGICPRGHAFSPTPGDNKSYAYVGSTGQVAHGAGSLRGSTVGNLDYGPCFGPGDTIGVLLNHRREVEFTRNGKSLGASPLPDLESTEIYFPCVWLLESGVRVSINFGQERFAYDFERDLPPGYVRDLKSASVPMEEDDVVGLTDEEVQRQTLAQMLLAMGMASDVRHCVIALERNDDDLNRAADWLLQADGQRILAEEEDKQLQLAMEQSKRLAEGGMPTPPRFGGDDDGGGGGGDDGDDDHVDMSDAFENRNASRFLDDEIDADIPVQIARRRRAADSLSIEDVFVGQFLTVNPSLVATLGSEAAARDSAALVRLASKAAASSHSASSFETAGRTGVVKQIDVNSMRVELTFFDRETSSKLSFWFDFQSLQRPLDLWNDPCAEILPSQVKRSIVDVEHSLCILKVRRAIFSLVAEWPAFPFDVASLGGASTLIDLLKLAASEFLQERDAVRRLRQQSLMDTLGARVASLVDAEHVAQKQSSDSDKLVPILIRECIAHFKRAVDVPPPKRRYRSPPLDQLNCDVRKRIHLDGASKLLVQFQHMDVDTSQLTRVAFFRDSQFQDVVASFRGREHRPVVIDGDTAYFRFQCGVTRVSGYRFTVTPYEMRLNDRQALGGLNFSLGYWLLELLLDHSPELIKERYSVQLYDSLVHYVNHSKRGAKARGIQLLLRVLQEMRIGGQAISMQEFEKLRVQMFRRYAIEHADNGQDGRELFSAHLQSLIELMSTARLAQLMHAERDLEPPSDDADDDDDDAAVAVVGKGKTKLKQQGQVATVTASSSTAAASPSTIRAPSLDDLARERKVALRIESAKISGVDVRLPLQRHVDRRFGGAYLHIPPQHENCEAFGGIAGALTIRYCLEVVGDAASASSEARVLDQCERRVPQGEALLVAPRSWFTDVVMTGLTALTVNKYKRFPRHAFGDAVRQVAMRDSYVRLADSIDIKTPVNGVGVADPGFLGPEFSLCFWLRVSASSLAAAAEEASSSGGGVAAATRQLLFKGSSGRRGQLNVTLNAQSGHLSVQLSTVRVASSAPLPLDRWSLVCVAVSVRSANVYLDGQQFASEMALASASQVVADPLYVGCVPTGVSPGGVRHDAAVARFADVRLYNRALAQSEASPQAYGSSAPSSSAAIALPTPPSAHALLASACRHGATLRDGAKWSVQHDAELVSLAHAMLDKSTTLAAGARDPMAVPLHELTFDEERGGHVLLRGADEDLLRLRFAMLRNFNLHLEHVFGLIDFSQSHIAWSLASALFAVKGFVFTRTKMAMWNVILQNTRSRGHGAVNVRINRIQSMKSRGRGDPECRRSVFGQLFQQLHFVAPETLRRHDQTWRVDLVAEGAQDAGGVFRDSISNLCEELQSDTLPLLVPVPNRQAMESDKRAQEQSGGGGDSSGFENWHMWVPNPRSTTAFQLRMYAFLGKLMGIAIRGRHLLNLDLPPLAWKLLVGERPTEHDVFAVDTAFGNTVRRLRGQKPLTRGGNDDAPALSEENFEYLIGDDMTFEVRTSNPGVSAELVVGGAKRIVTWQNRHDYCRLAVDYRIDECAVQIDAIRKGMAAILPLQLLPLFTWRELELQVCGKRELDLELLKRNTQYTHGVTGKEPHVALMWQMLANFEPHQAEQFLRFVWGRARLPIDDASFTQKFQVMRFSGARGKPEHLMLPRSHTCFNQLELPAYRTLEEMTRMITIAMCNCVSIDDDSTIDAATFARGLDEEIQ
jgi:HECT-domain (ubiquitin-transferase)/Concanavalin A-like lectin/glucanases superfamily